MNTMTKIALIRDKDHIIKFELGSENTSTPNTLIAEGKEIQGTIAVMLKHNLPCAL